MLVKLSIKKGLAEVDSLGGLDYMDDGTPIEIRITIDRTQRNISFDFTGTGPEVWGNLNTPRAVTSSAIIYVLDVAHVGLHDLKAQIAANQKGVELIREMIEHQGLEVVQAYMGHIQDNAEEAVRRFGP